MTGRPVPFRGEQVSVEQRSLSANNIISFLVFVLKKQCVYSAFFSPSYLYSSCLFISGRMSFASRACHFRNRGIKS